MAEQKNCRLTIEVKDGKVLTEAEFVDMVDLATMCGALQLLMGRPQCYVWEIYLIKAFGFILAKTEGRNFRVSQEAVGAAKVLKLAIRLYQFHMKLKEEGRTEYKVVEEFEYIRDILDA